MSITSGNIQSNFRYNPVTGLLVPAEITAEQQTVAEFTTEFPGYYGFTLNETPQTDIAGITEVKRVSDNQVFTRTTSPIIGLAEYFFDYLNDMPTLFFNSASNGALFTLKYFGIGGAVNAKNINSLVTARSVLYEAPIGASFEYDGIDLPNGFLWRDGSIVSRTTYATLFSKITSAKGTFTVTIATPAVVTLTGHGLATGDCVSLTTTGALPTGLSANTNYYVIYINANTFNLATSYANAIATVPTKINTTGSQSGTHSLLYNPWGISGASNFLLPDSLGAFPRGAGTSTKFTQNKTIGLGHYNDDAYQGFKIQTTGSNIWYFSLNGVNAALNLASAASFAGSQTTFGSFNQSFITDGTNGTPRTGNETAGKSYGTKYIIKAYAV